MKTKSCPGCGKQPDNNDLAIVPQRPTKDCVVVCSYCGTNYGTVTGKELDE